MPETPPEPAKPAEPTLVAKASIIEAPVETPPPKAKPRKLLILGDSMAATDLGREISKRLSLASAPKLQLRRKGKSATGLARPDFYNWPEVAEGLLKKPTDVVLVIIGGNDGQDLIAPPGVKARRVIFGSKGWPAAYEARVKAFAEQLSADDREVIWLELPAMEAPRLEAKLSLIRKIQAQALAGLPRVTYLKTRSHLTDAKGKILSEVTPKKGPAIKLRQADGIHFSLPGANYVADRVAEDVQALLGR